MQIYSKNKDYYDGQLIQISSLDRFVRQSVQKEGVLLNALPEGITKLPLDSRLQYLFFCGDLYPFVEDISEREVVRYDYKGRPIVDTVNKTSFLWSYDDIREYFDKHTRLGFYFEQNLQATFLVSDPALLKSIQLASDVCYFIFKPNCRFRYNSQLCRDNIAGDIVIYPSLQHIQFYKAVDAFTVAQQIDYWLGNIFVSDDCPSTQTNDEKVVAHGHDLRVSFRSESGKGKKKSMRK